MIFASFPFFVRALQPSKMPIRLLNVQTYALEYFGTSHDTPPYAILSHTWGEEEVLFDDLQGSPLRRQIQQMEYTINNLRQHIMGDQHLLESPTLSPASPFQPFEAKKGWGKVQGCCSEARDLGFSYVWIDTCCIDKSSSAELSETINSMFKYYRNADVCLAYLSDVDFAQHAGGDMTSTLRRSRWFERGWTLQELIAPKQLLFYDHSWNLIGDRAQFASNISRLTGIKGIILTSGSLAEVSQCNVATRFSWASRRKTTREEDMAYSLFGIFGVSLPILYGEGGERAFYRLQTEIWVTKRDPSMFFWFDCNPFTITASRQVIGVHDRNLLKPSLVLERIARSFMAPCALCFARSHVENAQDELDLLILQKKTRENPRDDQQVSDNVGEFRLLVGPSLPSRRRPNAKVHLAILPCRRPASRQFLGIYVLSRRDGRYERLGSSAIVDVRLKDRDFLFLTLATISISMPPFDVSEEDRNSLRSLGIWHAKRPRFYLETERLHNCGYRQIEYCSDSVFRVEQNGNNKMLVEGKPDRSLDLTIKFASETDAILLVIRHFTTERRPQSVHEYSLRAAIFPTALASAPPQHKASDYFDRLVDILPRAALFPYDLKVFLIRCNRLPDPDDGKDYSADPTVSIAISVRNRMCCETRDDDSSEMDESSPIDDGNTMVFKGW